MIKLSEKMITKKRLQIIMNNFQKNINKKKKKKKFKQSN